MGVRLVLRILDQVSDLICAVCIKIKNMYKNDTFFTDNEGTI